MVENIRRHQLLGVLVTDTPVSKPPLTFVNAEAASSNLVASTPWQGHRKACKYGLCGLFLFLSYSACTPKNRVFPKTFPKIGLPAFIIQIILLVQAIFHLNHSHLYSIYAY